MPNLVGIGNSQVPTNAMLGGLAYRNTVGEINIDKIKAKIGDTATNVFVYDTSKDSDGGAWRHRTQHTSWYNEPVSKTRGARREFPAIAVIVTTQKKVTIYDGDDPNLPMWMHFEFNSYPNMANLGYTPIGLGYCSSPPFRTHHISSVHALNGFMFIGGNRVLEADSSHTGWDLNFISEVMHEHLSFPVAAARSSKWRLDGNIAQRNSKLSTPLPTSRYGQGSSRGILGAVNDVAMIVEPNAPVDPYTKLPVPTYAVATNKGTTIVRENGIYEGETVVDVVYTSNPDTQYVDFRKSDNALVMSMNNNSIYVHVIHDIPTSNKTGSHPYQKEGIDDEFYRTGSSSDWSQSLWVDGGSPASTGTACRIENNVISGNGGINVIVPNRINHTKGMVAEIKNSYNTGYMFADCRGAFLSDTDDTNITGSELITNPGPNFSNTSGWGATNGSLSVSSGDLLLTGANNVNEHMYSAGFTLISGKTYVLFVDSNQIFSYCRIGTNIGLSSSEQLNEAVSVGLNSFTFTATTTGIFYLKLGMVTSYVTGSINSVSLSIAEKDRSVKGKGLQIHGQITKEPVNTNSELVSYSGFSATNFLDQPYNSDLNFGNNDFAVYGWFKLATNNSEQCIMMLMEPTGQVDYILIGQQSNGDMRFQVDSLNGASVAYATTLPTGAWIHYCGINLDDDRTYLYINGKNTELHNNTVHGFGGSSFDNTTGRLTFGRKSPASYNAASAKPFGGELALWRISKSVPSPEQIKKMYNEEKKLFTPNSKCTLYGTSDAVTALAFDDTNDVVHIGTSSGRSEFNGLNRINNTTTAVTTAISASNGLVAER